MWLFKDNHLEDGLTDSCMQAVVCQESFTFKRLFEELSLNPADVVMLQLRRHERCCQAPSPIS